MGLPIDRMAVYPGAYPVSSSIRGMSREALEICYSRAIWDLADMHGNPEHRIVCRSGGSYGFSPALHYQQLVDAVMNLKLDPEWEYYIEHCGMPIKRIIVGADGGNRLERLEVSDGQDT